MFGFALPFSIRPVWLGIGCWLLLVGLAGFVMMGIDKSRAVGGGWRTSELNLLFVAFIGGFWGVLLGSKAFNHKSSKDYFMAGTYAAAILWLVLLSQAANTLGPPISS